MNDETLKEEIDVWNNRRKMAWRSFYFAIAYIFSVLAFMVFADKESVKAATELGTVAIAVLGFFGGIVMAYIGAATWAEKK